MAESQTAVAGDTPIRATLLLHPREGERLAEDIAALARQPPQRRAYLDAAEFTRRYGAPREAADRVRAFAAAHDLEVLQENLPGRLMELAGTAESFTEAFSFRFQAVQHPSAQGTLLRPDHPVEVPAELQDIVEGVFGLDELPLFQRVDRSGLVATPPDTAAGSVDPENASPSAARIAQVEAGYRFPPESDGSGQSLAVILLGGGFYADDMKLYFGESAPPIRVVEVGGAKNDPAPRAACNQFIDSLSGKAEPIQDPVLSSQVWWTLEATVDLQLTGSFASGARLAAYFAPNNERGKIDAFVAALTAQEDPPAVISCSWGMREADADADYLRSLDRLFQLAALRGISICYSSGDSGADVGADGLPRVHFPASSPHVLGCGGTRLSLPDPQPAEQAAWDESRDSTVLATGGGYSEFFSRPGWQDSALGDGSGRGVPDVAGKADYGSGYLCTLVGRAVLGGGTSVAAPMWASLLSRLNQEISGRVGWLSPILYGEDFSTSLEVVTQGGNGYYEAGPGWDPCTGLGTPIGKALLVALRRP